MGTAREAAGPPVSQDGALFAAGRDGGPAVRWGFARASFVKSIFGVRIRPTLSLLLVGICVLGAGRVRAEEESPLPTVSLHSGRTVFERMEPDAFITVTVYNPFDIPLRAVALSVTMDGRSMADGFRFPDVPAAESAEANLPMDTSLKPGRYPLTVQVTARAGRESAEFSAEGSLTLVARRVPNEMPVVIWGTVADMNILREVGVTHSLLWMEDHGRVWAAGEPVVPVREGDRHQGLLWRLDARLAAGLRDIASINPGRWLVSGSGAEERRARFNRVTRAGEIRDRGNVCGLFPEMQRFAWNVGVSVGQSYGRHPALDGALIQSELRDGTNLCFHDHDRAAYREHSGREIPEAATDRGGIRAAQRGAFVPRNGVVPDDDPILDYYRWFWTVGDGWHEMHSQVHRGLQTEADDRFWTFNDPAVRCPPVWGSGGEVDVISQWTYTYPEPPRIGLATDELFAMAEGRPGQQVMKMTQIIWYRNQTAPDLPEREEDRTAWEKEAPEARFITIAPDHLREAFWLKIARPVQGIMYHGINSLVGGLDHPSYRYTNPETRVVLAELIRDVVRPLGPTLMQIPDAPSDVAMLQSFTSMIFGAEGTWGWGRSWVADMHQVLQWARLQPRVMYEDAILRDGLDGVRVLVMPNCPVLPRSVVDQILAFQRRGGVVVGDPDLAPAIVPDIRVRNPGRGGAPDVRKARLQEVAEQLRAQLTPIYDWPMDSSDPDLIVYRRVYGETEYLFAVNDKRTYGDYVGHHRRVMEKGLFHEGTLFMARPGATVYDLRDGRAVETRSLAAGVEWEAKFGPADGRMFMVTPRPIAGVHTEIVERRAEDRTVEVQVQIVDSEGVPLDAVIPVRIDIRDPTGAEAEFSGYYGAGSGTVTVRLDLAANDAPGAWTVHVREEASGITAETHFLYRADP